MAEQLLCVYSYDMEMKWKSVLKKTRKNCRINVCIYFNYYPFTLCTLEVTNLTDKHRPISKRKSLTEPRELSKVKNISTKA